MWPFDWVRNLFHRKIQRTIDEGVTEKAFGVTPVTSRVMKSNIQLWYALYVNRYKRQYSRVGYHRKWYYIYDR